MLSGLLILASVIFIDVLLSGDNAVVVAMAANTLDKSQRNRAIAAGMGIAAFIRIVLSIFATSLLQYRLVSIVGGLGLLWVVFKLSKDILEGKKEHEGEKTKQGTDLISTMIIIATADVSMSLDNTLAVAGIARNNPVLLALGLLASIGMMAFCAKVVSGWMDKWKGINWVGVGLITLVSFELIFGIRSL